MSPLAYNMRCPRGHLWYSPNPEAWVGQMCGHTYDRRQDGTAASHGRCESTLTRIGKTRATTEKIPY